MKNKPSINRRDFLRQSSCAAVGTATLYSTLFTLRLTASAATAEPLSGYKALVCLFLAGGNDSFNMLVPGNASAYAEYAAVRSDLALAQGSLLPVASSGQPYSEFGIHPNLPILQTLYNQGNAAFVSNVGTLIEPTTPAQYQAKSVDLPVGLFSHSDEQMHWQTVVPQVRGAVPKGWAGRMADCMASANPGGVLPANVSLSGVNTLQTGQSTVHYTTRPDGAIQLTEYAYSNAAIDGILARQYNNLYHKTLSSTGRTAIDTAVAFNDAVSPVTLTETFPNTKTGSQLSGVAKVLAARTALGMNRQIFFVKRGGWDHHNEVLDAQEGLFMEVNAAIETFWTELGHLGLQNDVVLFTISDFGRTLTSNGQGSDHAWGGNAFMVGGGLNGGTIYGSYPELAAGSSLDIGRGRLLPTTSVDEYCAELASWFGVSPTELSTVLPNATNFFNPLTTPHPLGILG